MAKSLFTLEEIGDIISGKGSSLLGNDSQWEFVDGEDPKNKYSYSVQASKLMNLAKGNPSTTSNINSSDNKNEWEIVDDKNNKEDIVIDFSNIFRENQNENLSPKSSVSVNTIKEIPNLSYLLNQRYVSPENSNHRPENINTSGYKIVNTYQNPSRPTDVFMPPPDFESLEKVPEKLLNDLGFVKDEPEKEKEQYKENIKKIKNETRKFQSDYKQIYGKTFSNLIFRTIAFDRYIFNEGQGLKKYRELHPNEQLEMIKRWNELTAEKDGVAIENPVHIQWLYKLLDYLPIIGTAQDIFSMSNVEDLIYATIGIIPFLKPISKGLGRNILENSLAEGFVNILDSSTISDTERDSIKLNIDNLKNEIIKDLEKTQSIKESPIDYNNLDKEKIFEIKKYEKKVLDEKKKEDFYKYINGNKNGKQ